MEPSAKGANGLAEGRDASTGQFVKGYKGGPGNPHAKQVAVLRRELIAAVSADDMRAITKKLIELARAGNVNAIREVYDRTLGKPVEADLIERMEEIEAWMAGRMER